MGMNQAGSGTSMIVSNLTIGIIKDSGPICWSARIVVIVLSGPSFLQMGLCLSCSGGLLWTCKRFWAQFVASSGLHAATLQRIAADVTEVATFPNRNDI